MDLTQYTGYKLNVDVYHKFLTQEEADVTFSFLENLVPWTTLKKRTKQSYGDFGLAYTLQFKQGPVEVPVKPWTDIPILAPLRRDISRLTSSFYNYCVIQRYPNGRVGIKPHRDKEMRPDTNITGLSLGATRTLVLSYRSQTVRIPLPPGSVYVLKAPTNSYWSHSIEPEQEVDGVRLSLTFRFQ